MHAGALHRSGKGGASEVERQAKRVAFYVYFNLKPDEARRHLLPADLEALLPPDQARAHLIWLPCTPAACVPASLVRWQPCWAALRCCLTVGSMQLPSGPFLASTLQWIRASCS